jgi:hypothetical protein
MLRTLERIWTLLRIKATGIDREWRVTAQLSRRRLEREAMKFKGATPVTRVTVMTARCGARRVALPLIGAFIAFSLAACETSSNSSVAPVSSPLAAPQVKSKPIAFAPVIGAPAKVSSKMNELLIASAGQKNIPVVGSKEAEYTVRGYLVAAADAKGTKLSYIWDITDKGGKRAKRIQGDELIEGKKGGDPWALVDEAVMQRVAGKTADDLIAWIPSSGNAATTASTDAAPSQPVAQAVEPSQQRTSRTQEASANVLAVEQPAPTSRTQPASGPTGPAVAFVPPVTGAPGDGEASLTGAMRRALEQAGVKLIEGSDPNAYVVRGSVQLGNPDGGQQPITIRWLVVDPTGKTMEKAVVQRNKVPEGSLNGTWGQVADLAAGEAARSVAKLIKPAT